MNSLRNRFAKIYHQFDEFNVEMLFKIFTYAQQ